MNLAHADEISVEYYNLCGLIIEILQAPEKYFYLTSDLGSLMEFLSEQFAIYFKEFNILQVLKPFSILPFAVQNV